MSDEIATHTTLTTEATERKPVEDELRRSRERFEELINSIEGVVWEADPETFQFKFVSQQAEKLLGYPVEQWLSEPDFWVRRLHPEDREWAVRYCIDAVAKRELHTFDYRLLAADGRVVWIRDTANLKIEGGLAVCLRGTMIDITEQVRAEEEFARLAAIVESSDDAIISQTLDGYITSWNAGAERIYGYAESEVVGQHISMLIPSGQTNEVPKIIERLKRGERGEPLETVRRRNDGQLINVSLVVSAIKDSAGDVTAVSVIARDITGQKAMEEQLLQSQKMESVGRLAGGVAHDFNNLLTVVNGYGELALRKLDKGDPLRPYIEEIKKAGERASNLTRQLLAFSRKQILQPKVIDLNDHVTEANKMLRRLIGEDIEIVLTLRPNLWKVRVDPSQLDQVLVNLVVNARDAMPHGGCLTISTNNVTVDDDFAHRTDLPQPGPHVLLTVSDTGHGMDDGTRARIFEPFFTTKDVGKGTGLGLSTVYGIISQSGGFVTIESEPGSGAAFKIYLPRVEDETRETGAGDDDEALQRGTETILLVEDEEIVRTMTQSILEECGYTVLSAADGRHALEVCASHAGHIDLLLTDVVMPQMSGRRLAEHLRTTHPHTRVLYMSGYTDDAILRHGVTEETAAFMEKPYSPATLTRKVREVLDALM